MYMYLHIHTYIHTYTYDIMCNNAYTYMDIYSVPPIYTRTCDSVRLILRVFTHVTDER